MVEALERCSTNGESDDLSADLVSSFENRDRMAQVLEDAGGCQPEDASADNADVHGATGLSPSAVAMWVTRFIEMPKPQRKKSPRMVVGMKMAP